MDLLPTFFKPVDIFSSEQEVAWIISFLFGRSDTDRHWTFLTVHAPGDPVDFFAIIGRKNQLGCMLLLFQPWGLQNNLGSLHKPAGHVIDISSSFFRLPSESTKRVNPYPATQKCHSHSCVSLHISFWTLKSGQFKCLGQSTEYFAILAFKFFLHVVHHGEYHLRTGKGTAEHNNRPEP